MCDWVLESEGEKRWERSIAKGVSMFDVLNGVISNVKYTRK
jgi:hypothetical protein